MIETEDCYDFAVHEYDEECLQEVHGLMRKLSRLYTALYSSNYLSQHVKIDMMLCVDYMLTKNVNTSPLVQQIFVVFGLYHKIQL